MNRTRLRAIRGLYNCNRDSTCAKCVYNRDRDCARHMYQDALRMLVIDDNVVGFVKKALKDLRRRAAYREMASEILDRIDKLEHGANYEKHLQMIKGISAEWIINGGRSENDGNQGVSDTCGEDDQPEAYYG